MIVRAKYLVDHKLSVVDNGAVRILDGWIREIGPAGRLRGKPVADFGDSILLPGLVNAHTHLELGFTAGKVPPTPDFTDWLRRLMEHLRRASADEALSRRSIEDGLGECLESGATLIGDVTRDPARTRAVVGRVARRPAVVSFGEVIAVGTLRHTGDERLAGAADESQRSASLHVGVSPHAAYSVEPQVLRACVAEAGKRKQPLCIHAAETREEHEYTLRASGSLRAYLEELGVWDDAVPVIGLRPLEYLARCGALGESTVLAHCNYVNDDDLELLAKTRTNVAYCPRTHHAFGHDPHPFRRMIAAGVNVCLGTDSLASNPSLSVLEEMRFLKRRHPDVDARTVLRMGTEAGARALGFGAVTGALLPGRRADLIVLPLAHHGPSDPVEDVLASDRQPLACIVAGKQFVG